MSVLQNKFRLNISYRVVTRPEFRDRPVEKTLQTGINWQKLTDMLRHLLWVKMRGFKKITIVVFLTHVFINTQDQVSLCHSHLYL
jgi:hypothetical protein